MRRLLLATPTVEPIRIGRAWWFASERRLLPVLSGAAEGDGAPVEFVVPDDLADLDDEALAALLEDANRLFDEASEADANEQTVAVMTQLADAIEKVQGEIDARVAHAEEIAQAAAAQIARVRGGDAPVEEPPAADAPAPVVPAAPAVETPEQIAAAAPPAGPTRIVMPIRQAARTAPRPEVPTARPGLSIVAAGDMGRYRTNDPMTVLDIAEAMHDRARTLPAARGNGVYAPVARIERPSSTTIVASAADAEATDSAWRDAMSAMYDGPRQSAEALVAAGGWCTPSEQSYDLFSIEDTDGLIDVPSFPVSRGGIKWPTSPSIIDILGSGNTSGVPWLWTETDDTDAIVGGPEDTPTPDNPTKPCIRVPCPDFDNEERLDAHGICVTHGNLADRAYPEMTRRFIDLVMAAHEHLVSYRLITAMAAASDHVTTVASKGTGTAILGSLELQVQDYRDKYRMNENAVLEAVFPRWIRGMIRTDLARRNGVDTLAVTDAQIVGYMTARGIRPQFVSDWQALNTGPSTAAGSADGFRESWPATLDYLLYAAGTFGRGNGGSLDLGVVRDSTLNKTNDFTAAWSEEFILLAKRGYESRRVTVAVAPDGTTGAQAAFPAPGA